MKTLVAALLVGAFLASPAFALDMNNSQAQAWGQAIDNGYLGSAQMHAQYGLVAGQVLDAERGMLTSNSINCNGIGANATTTNNISGNENDLKLGTINNDAHNSGDVDVTCNFTFNTNW